MAAAVETSMDAALAVILSELGDTFTRVTSVTEALPLWKRCFCFSPDWSGSLRCRLVQSRGAENVSLGREPVENVLIVKMLQAFKCLLCRWRYKVPCYICLFGLVATVQPNYGGREGQRWGQREGQRGGGGSWDFNYSSLRLLQHFIFISLGDYFLNLFDICLTKNQQRFLQGPVSFRATSTNTTFIMFSLNVCVVMFFFCAFPSTTAVPQVFVVKSTRQTVGGVAEEEVQAGWKVSIHGGRLMWLLCLFAVLIPGELPPPHWSTHTLCLCVVFVCFWRNGSQRLW